MTLNGAGAYDQKAGTRDEGGSIFSEVFQRVAVVVEVVAEVAEEEEGADCPLFFQGHC